MVLKKPKPLIILSALVFTFGLTSFTVSNVHSSSTMFFDEPCYHCGSVEACEEGGQPYGFFQTNGECEIVYGETGSEACDFDPGPKCSQIPDD